MNKKQFIRLIRGYKYIFIGEIHGTKQIPKIVLKLLNYVIKNNKMIFCLEIPTQAEKALHEYLNNKIKKSDFLKLHYLKDAVFDKRITNYTLNMYKNLHKGGIIFKCLEDYDENNQNKRDENMAKRFIEIVNNYKVDKYIIYVGNLHVIEKSVKINNFRINPIKIYLPEKIIKKVLTIKFNKSDIEKINFNRGNNTIDYKMPLK